MENSHLPFRKRERAMQGYWSPGGVAAVRVDPLDHPELLFRSSPSPLRINNQIPPLGGI